MNRSTARGAAMGQNGHRIHYAGVVLFYYPPHSPALPDKKSPTKHCDFFTKGNTTGYLLPVLQKLVFSLGSSLQPPFDCSRWLISPIGQY